MDIENLTAPERFFYEHASWSHGPDESPEVGRIRCARESAAAEVAGAQAGIMFEWVTDPDSDSGSWDDTPEHESYAVWGCLAYLNGEVAASLWSIDLGRDVRPCAAPYARVVQAELAGEALRMAESPVDPREAEFTRRVMDGE